MVSYEGARASFNSMAAQYDASRPTYPPALIRHVIERAGLTSGSRILEIGAGTGKATFSFAQRGYEMLCLEPGVEMGKILRRNLAAHRKAKVKTATFEEWRAREAPID